MRRSRSATSAASWPRSACGDRGPRRPGCHDGRRRGRRRDPAAPRDEIPDRPGAGPRLADQLCRGARLGAHHRGGLGGDRLGSAPGGRRRGVSLEPFGYRALDAAPDGEGLPLLRDRPDDARDAVRGRSRGVCPARQGALRRARRPSRRARRQSGRPAGACGRSSSAARTTCRSTAGRRSASMAR